MSMPLFSSTVAHLSIYSTRFREALEGRTPNTRTDTTTISSSTTAPLSGVSSPKDMSEGFAVTRSLCRSNPEASNNLDSMSANGVLEHASSLDTSTSTAPRRQFTHRREELRQRQEKDASTISVPLSTNAVNTGEEVTSATIPSVHQEEAASPNSSPDSVRSMTSPSSLVSFPTNAGSVDATITTEKASSFSSVSSSPPSAPPRYYFCDVCSQGCFTSFEDAEAHLLDAHMSHIPGYQLLRTVVGKLLDRDVWAAVKEGKRKDGTLEACGRRVLEEGRRKDPGPERMQEAHRAREQLESVVQQWHPTARVYIFGSSVTFGIWDGMGDIDFTVVDEGQLRAGTWPPPERNAVRSITELLRRAGFSYVNLEPISHARVPIIKHHASFPLRLEPSAVRRSMEAVAAEVELEKEEEECVSTTPSHSLPLENSQDMVDKGSAATTLEGKKVEKEAPLLQKSLLAASEKPTKDLRFSLARRLEAEDIISRSVRYVLNGSADWEDRLLLEASIREAVGATSVQQVWWNRTRDLMNVTLDTTTNAIKAATCPLAVVSPTLRARIQPLHEDCRPELYNIDFDLSFRVFGIRNSQLLRRYLMQHPCARPGAMILKEWSKRSGVNNSVNGFLTSYAVAIMWLYFLLQKKVVKFVDPVKDVPASLEGCPMNPVYVPMVDSQWSKQEQALYATQGGELLVEFFYFYAVEFDWKSHVVSLNRPGITTKASLGWYDEGEGFFHFQQGGNNGNSHRGSMGSGESGSGAASLAPSIQTPRRHAVQYNFCIEDPYEENLNLGRHMGLTKTLRVQTEFYRGLLSLLKEGSKDSCVFPPPSLSSASGLSSSAFHGAKAGRNAKKVKSKSENDCSTKMVGEKHVKTNDTLQNDEEVAPMEMEMEEKAFFTEGKGLVPPSTLAHKVLYRLMIVCLKEMTKLRRVYEEEVKKKEIEKSKLSSSADSQMLSSMKAKIDPISSTVKEEKGECVAQISAMSDVEKPSGKCNSSPSILTPPTSSSEDEREGSTLSFSAKETVDTSPISQENEAEVKGSVEEDAVWGGVPQEELRRALELHAPIELKIGLKAWNWQQLLHRLGYKCHRDRVFSRREVGPSQLQHRRVSGGVGTGVAVATTASTTTTTSSSQAECSSILNEDKKKEDVGPLSSGGVSEESQFSTPCSHAPPGVIPSTYAREVMGITDSSSASSFVSSESIFHRNDKLPPLPTTADALRQLPARGLTEEMQAHLSEGFLKLTPEWVPWSEPWAGNAMHATSTANAAVSSSPSCPSTASRKVGCAGSHAGGGGGLHRTPKTSFYCRYPSFFKPPSLFADFQDYRRLALKEKEVFSSSAAICRCSSSSSLCSFLSFASHSRLLGPFLFSSRVLLSPTSPSVLENLRVKCKKGELVLATSVAMAVYHFLFPYT